MDFLTLFLISTGLAMDAFAVSITNGAIVRELQLRHAIRMAFFFGLFQAMMPLVGWSLGQIFYTWVSTFGHWIAFGLLVFVGGKMIYEALQDEECSLDNNCMSIQNVLILSVATSIDAMAVGISFSLLHLTIWFPIVVIGSVTFVLSLIGAYIGDRLGTLFENKVEWIGGLILIGIGIKILFEHYFF